MYTIVAINPGSTSTKVAIYNDDKVVRELTLRHSTEELAPFANVIDQFDFRKNIILNAMKEAGVKLSDIDAVIGRGGLIKPVKSGVYEVNETMIDDIRNRPVGHHASNLGALLAYDIAKEAGAKAYMADPVVVDELQDVARITGHPDIERVSIFHALNQKAMARAYAEKHGKRYEDLNLIVVHLGGGISVGAHCKGEVIDVNNALEGEGPFSPERMGGLPALAVAKWMASGKYTVEQISKFITSKGGFVAHFGTNSAMEISRRAENGDKRAALLQDEGQGGRHYPHRRYRLREIRVRLHCRYGVVHRRSGSHAGRERAGGFGFQRAACIGRQTVAESLRIACGCSHTDRSPAACAAGLPLFPARYGPRSGQSES